ncbi:phosphoglycolate phosphatase, partial [Pasteurella multocida subsp. multocida str. Anand1_cattle]
MTQFKLIGFDLDGTLVNSLPDLALSVNSAFAEFDLPQAPEDLVLTWIGNGADILMRVLWHGRRLKRGNLNDEQLRRLSVRFGFI